MHSWELPNPFLKQDGTMLSDPKEWAQQREYLRGLLTEHLYGQAPPRPAGLRHTLLEEEQVFGGRGISAKVELVCGEADAIRIPAFVVRPNDTAAHSTVVLPMLTDDAIVEMAVTAGFCVVVFDPTVAAPDSSDYTEGACAKAYPGYSWKVIAMWGWLHSCVFDWLETQPYVDTTKLVAAGHSRYGKSALCCTIYDERVAICAPVGSGCGGMGSLRNIGSRMGPGTGFVETIGTMMKPDALRYWYVDSLAQYGNPEPSHLGHENELPFDANFMGACVAPAGLMVLEGLDDTWSNPYGTLVSWAATGEVYRFLNMAEKCALHCREGGHAFNMEDWTALLDFCKVTLDGEEKQTNYKTVQDWDVRTGYNWRCPGKQNLTMQQTFAGIRPAQQPQRKWSFRKV